MKIKEWTSNRAPVAGGKKHVKSIFNLVWPHNIWQFVCSVLWCVKRPMPSVLQALKAPRSWVSHSCANNQSLVMASGLEPTISVHVLLGLREAALDRKREESLHPNQWESFNSPPGSYFLLLVTTDSNLEKISPAHESVLAFILKIVLGRCLPLLGRCQWRRHLSTGGLWKSTVQIKGFKMHQINKEHHFIPSSIEAKSNCNGNAYYLLNISVVFIALIEQRSASTWREAGIVISVQQVWTVLQNHTKLAFLFWFSVALGATRRVKLLWVRTAAFWINDLIILSSTCSVLAAVGSGCTNTGSCLQMHRMEGVHLLSVFFVENKTCLYVIASL